MSQYAWWSLDTKSIDVGSMFLIELSVEESRDPAPDTVGDENEFREEQQPTLVAKTITSIAAKTPTTTAPPSSLIATSKNSEIIGDEEDERSIFSIDSATDIPIPQSNAHRRRRLSSSSVIFHQIPSIGAADSLNQSKDNSVVGGGGLDDIVDDEFLQQEYNDNHHNHYSTDESDDEPPSAEDNPMKLFESIQALARSLHEDAELFGSLPPKRTLESPIRSLLLT